ncbi:hypothetical protein ZTR_02161 [Talaromyces verruculosus]|nr:hypothetical protein ZTR_02161 [Talaromyces verruculosus]
MAFLTVPKLNTRKGTFRAYHLAAVVFISSFLAGYDSGVAGGVLTYKPFESDLRYAASTESKVSSLTIGLNQLGSFLACFFFYPFTNKFGRKYAITLAAFIYVIGSMIQTIITHSLGAWYGVAQSETISKTSREWQIPIGLEIIPSGILFLAMFTLPESVRWLLSQNRTDEAWKSLSWIRGDEGDKTQEEFNETKAGLIAEESAKDNFTIRELWHPSNRLRFIVGPAMFIFQNTTGSSALAVFAPQYFKLLVGSSGNRDLLLTGLFGAIKVIGCTFFIWFLAEQLSRRTLLIGGASLMATCMLIITLIVRFIPTENVGNVTSAGRATVAMIYLDIVIYNCSWGPVPWVYVPEIFPTRIRALGLGFSMLAHWATSFCFSFASPYMIKNIGAYTFLIFMGFDVCAAIFTYFFAQETRGKVLEAAAGTDFGFYEKDGLTVVEKGVNS